jgi:hypothetical protein
MPAFRQSSRHLRRTDIRYLISESLSSRREIVLLSPPTVPGSIKQIIAENVHRCQAFPTAARVHEDAPQCSPA